MKNTATLPSSAASSPEFAYRDIDHFFRKRHFLGGKMKENSVTAKFHDRRNLDRAVLALQSVSFRNDNIFLTTSHGGSVLDSPLRIVSIAPFLVPTCILAGIVLGGLLGYLTQKGNVPFFGIPPFMFMSQLVSISACGTVGAFIGGMLGCIFGMRFPEYDPAKYQTNEPDGTFFLVVRTVGRKETRLAQDTLAPMLEGNSRIETRVELAA